QRGEVTPVKGREGRNAAQQQAELPAERPTLRGLAVERSPQVGRSEVGEEAALLVLELVPFVPELTERPGDETVGRIPADDRRRAPSPRLEPEPVGAEHVHEHRAQIRLAELLADLTAGGLVPERGDNAEEPAIRPVMVRPVLADQLDGHDSLLSPWPPR